MNFWLRRGFSSLFWGWSGRPQASMSQGPYLNNLGMHIGSSSVGSGEILRIYSPITLSKGKLLRVNTANSAKAPQAISNSSYLRETSDGMSFLAAPRIYYSPIIGGSIFRWPRFCASAHSSRCYTGFPKSQAHEKDDMHSEEKRGVSGVLGSKGNFGSNGKFPRPEAARSRKSVDTAASGSGNGHTVTPAQELSAKQGLKVQGQQELSSPKESNKKAKCSAAALDEDSQSKGSRMKTSPKRSSSKKKQEHNRNVNEPEESLHCSVTQKSASSKKTKNQSSKMTTKSLEKQGPLQKVNTETPEDTHRKTSSVNSRKGSNLKPLYPPSGKSVVIVESVTKAKVIQHYLGDMFEVLPSYGHVRDLAARSGSVRPDEDFSMVWEVPSPAWIHLKSMKVALSGADNLILASDPDREGEAIAWHIIEMLQKQNAIRDDITVARVVFHEITESSIKAALQSPRDVDANLVHAYLARRALDYLIGFNISPLLWRKLPGCQSAGRVQSAALALICDREMEIDEFKSKEYWSVGVGFNRGLTGSTMKPVSFKSYLTYFASQKLNKLSIGSHTEAKNIEEKILSTSFKVTGSRTNKTRKNPPTPYITSTLQQDAANKLQFPATYTMKLAQKLYEGVQLSDGTAVGLITYMRTDGLHISDEAIKEINSLVTERYGPDFASKTARKYFKKVKNAQEAHEAIRPTDVRRLPSMLAEVLEEDSLKLYSLIWSRAMACQMEPAIFSQVQVEIRSADESIAFGSSCSKNDFLGYQAVFKDKECEVLKSKEEEIVNDHVGTFEVLKSFKEGDHLTLDQVELKQHFTQPPSRYSEGSLVKKLEDLGIGRPSTYASTLKVLQDRNYVSAKSRVLYPEFRARMVSAFLSHHFSEVTEYSFTADMEAELDNVSAGVTEWKGLLKDYWSRFRTYCDRAATVHIHQVEKMLEKRFANFLFASLPGQNRTCPSCMEGKLIFKVSRYGAGYFIGCDQHPRCKHIAKTFYGDEEEDAVPQNNTTIEEPKLLGLHPVSQEKILLKNGPYGYYIQLGEDKRNYTPKRANVGKLKDVDSITLEDALELLRYPITVGEHPTDGHPVILKLAKVGFTIRHRRTTATVPKNIKPDEVTMEKALELLSGKNVRRCGRPKGKRKDFEEALEIM